MSRKHVEFVEIKKRKTDLVQIRLRSCLGYNISSMSSLRVIKAGSFQDAVHFMR